MANDTSVPFWWILLFVVLALAFGAGAVAFVGGDVTGATGFLVP